MKYKKHITAGVIVLSLFVGGSSALAATQQGRVAQHYGFVKNSHQTNKIKNNRLVGSITAVNATGFTVENKNLKTKSAVSFEVQTTSTTTFSKDGATATFSDIALGEKVIVGGKVDAVSRIISATKVNIVTKTPIHKFSKKTKKEKNVSQLKLKNHNL